MGLTRKADRYDTLTGSRKGEKVSRQEYLKKMEQKKLKELRDDIEDEQYLFDGVKLTEAEYGELRDPQLLIFQSITRVENYQLPPDAPPLAPVLGCAEDIGQLTLWNLTHLELGVIYLSKVMLDLLSKMPNLESLKLIMDYECYFGNDEEKEFYRIQWHAVPCCLLSHLKVIEIDNFRGRENDLLLVEYFLKNAKVLNKMAKI